MKKPDSYRAVLVALLAATVACGASTQLPSSPSSASAPVSVIVALGDSITAGFGLKPEESYPALLQQRITADGYRYRLMNAGVSGDTTGDALRRLDAALVPATSILIVALGANDGLRRLSPDTVEANLSTIIERAQARGIDVLLCTMEALPIGGFEYTVAFHRIFTRLEDRYHVTRAPFVMVDVVADPNLTLRDRIHPNAAGARIIADRLWPYLQPMLKKP
jgi:acyl-CoA thioesterase I